MKAPRLRGLLPALGFALLALAVVASALWIGDRTQWRHLAWVQPWWLLAAVLPPLALLVRTLVSPRPATLRFSRARTLSRVPTSWAVRFVHLPDGLRVAAGVLLAVALARPQSTRGATKLRHEGIDIVVALDLSESMKSSDMPPSRLRVAQEVIDDFIRRRPDDRIGVVAFGSEASTVAPLTMDHGVLRVLVKRLRTGLMDGSRTAIGAGLGLAINRLMEAEAVTRIVVLLTDGVHNADGLDPDSAAQQAAREGITVYTILIGQQDMGDDSVDPGRLERIASITGGYAYTASDQAALVGSFQDLLDKLEKSMQEGDSVRPELFPVLLWPALFMLLFEVLLRSTWLRRFP
jgi:Ca-activated chloride channel family protein